MGCSKPPMWLREKIEKNQKLTKKENKCLEQLALEYKNKKELISLLVSKYKNMS